MLQGKIIFTLICFILGWLTISFISWLLKNFNLNLILACNIYKCSLTWISCTIILFWNNIFISQLYFIGNDIFHRIKFTGSLVVHTPVSS